MINTQTINQPQVRSITENAELIKDGKINNKKIEEIRKDVEKYIDDRDEWLLGKAKYADAYTTMSPEEKSLLDDLVFLNHETHALRELEFLYFSKITPNNQEKSDTALSIATQNFLARKNTTAQNITFTAYVHDNPKYDCLNDKLLTATAEKHIKANICSLHEDITNKFKTYLISRGYSENLINPVCKNLDQLSTSSAIKYADSREKIKTLLVSHKNANIKLLEDGLSLVKNNATEFKKNYVHNLKLIANCEKNLEQLQENKTKINKKLQDLSVKSQVHGVILETSPQLFAEIGYENWSKEMQDSWVDYTDTKDGLSKPEAISKFKELISQIDSEIDKVTQSKQLLDDKIIELNQSLNKITEKSIDVINEIK